MVTPERILSFWLDEIGPKGWYVEDAALDQKIRDAFEPAWRSARAGSYALWLTYPSGTLAYLILLDQFPRNMYRGTAEAFATDKIARTATKAAIDRDWDRQVDEPARQFFYLPLMHSEFFKDQDRCVRLVCDRLPETGAPTLLHARAHREIIRRFGRFPYRNAALGRESTPEEVAFMEEGGYGQIVQALSTPAETA